MRGEIARCFHCGADIPPGIIVEDRCGEASLPFCCHGCHGAYLLITGAGLDDFYRRREWGERGLPSRAYQDSYRDPYLSRFVYRAKDLNAIDILIDGIRCASCVWLNERIIGRLRGVREVRVNYATARARVVFDPSKVTPAAIFASIAEIGYVPRPYSPSEADERGRLEQKDLLFRFGTAFFLSMQLMAYSFALYAGYFQGMATEMKGYLQLFSLLVTTPVVFYCGRPFLSGAWRSLRNLTPNMELLIAIGTLSSFGYSVYATFQGGEVYYETPAMIVTLILAGRLLENSARRKAAAGIGHLFGLCAGEARRFSGERLETVDPSELREGDIVLVAAGERFPVDGTIFEGSTDVDESAATGEALPVVKSAGESVLAGTSNLTGAVRVTCQREWTESFMARVARLVEEAQSRRAPIQGLADRVSAWFVPVVIASSVATFIWHFYASGEALGAAMMNALAVLVVACPCALGLATPTAMVAGTGAAAMRGVIFRGGDVLERLALARVAVFDKTGTLTCGSPVVSEVRAATGIAAEDLLSIAASIEAGSLHPIGKAIRAEAARQGKLSEAGEELRAVAGGGMTGKVAGEEIAVGSPAFLGRLEVTGIPEESAPPGSSMVCLARGGRYCGTIIVSDRIRDDAPRLVDYFNRAGIRTILLSGDREKCAAETAAAVGIGAGFGELSPEGKAARIEELRSEVGCVLMVGDGINDAPALSAADVGCAVGGGTDIAIETSDLVLIKPDLERLSFAHRMACRTMSVVRQNLAWAFLYNAVGIPLAISGRLTPVVAAAAMAVSSLCVVGNSLRLTGGRRG